MQLKIEETHKTLMNKNIDEKDEKVSNDDEDEDQNVEENSGLKKDKE